MSIINSIAKCKKRIGHGASRNVFYSRRYNVVIKRMRDPKCAFDNDQMQSECELFDSMTEAEKEIFPITGYVELKNGEKVVMMKKCEVVDDLNEYRRAFFAADGYRTQVKFWDEAARIAGLDTKTNKCLADFIKKNGITDVHHQNVGVLNNHFVLIDAGCR